MMRFLTFGLCVLLATLGMDASAQANSKLQRIIGTGAAIGIGAAILNDFNRRGLRVQQKKATSTPPPAGRWIPLSPDNGTGTTICNDTDDAYTCFAFRCGKGRGVEFAFFYNEVEYGTDPVATISVDDGPAQHISFKTIVPNGEMAATFNPAQHEELIAALQRGHSFTFNAGDPRHANRFSLRGSSKEIERTFRQCDYQGFDSGAPVTVNQGTQGLDGMGGKSVAQAEPAEPTQPQRDDISWREDDTQESYVARIRQAAALSGGSCDEEQAVIEGLQRNIKVSIDRDKVRAGELVTLNWTGNTLTERLPVYLMVATDAPVRFKGEGLYPLPPNAVGPFGMDTFSGKTRAIVPLFGQYINKVGSFQIRVLSTGIHELDWNVVGYVGKCGKIVEAAPSTFQLSAIPQTPEIVAGSEEDYGKYDFVLDHEDSHSRVLVADRFFTIVDRVTGTPVATHEGADPAFSATGRFVAAEMLNSDTEEINQFAIYDTVDGALVAKIYGHTLSWAQSDMFVSDATLGDGSLSVSATFPLIEGDRQFGYYPGPVGFNNFSTGVNAAVQEYQKLELLFEPESGVFRNSTNFISAVVSESSLSLKASTADNEMFARLFRRVPSGAEYIYATGDGNFAERFPGAAKEYEAWREKSRIVPPKRQLPFAENKLVGIPLDFLQIAHAARQPLFTYGGYSDGAWEHLIATRKVVHGSRTRLTGDRVAMLTAPLKTGDWRALGGSGQVSDAAVKLDILGQVGLASVQSREVPAQVNSNLYSGDFYGVRRQTRFKPDAEFQKIADQIRSTVTPFTKRIDFKKTDLRARNCGGDAGFADERDADWKRNFFGDTAKIWRLGEAGAPRFLIQELCYNAGPETGNEYSNFYFVGPEYPNGGMVYSPGEKPGPDGRVIPVSEVGERYNQDFSARVDTTSVMEIGDGRIALLDRTNAALVVFEMHGAGTAHPLNHLPKAALIDQIYALDDPDFLLLINTDGSFYVQRISDNATTLEGRLVDDEVIVWTPDLHFDSTAEGAHFVNLKFPGQPGQYTFQQFDSRLRVAGLAEKVLSGEYERSRTEVGVPPRLSGRLDIRDGRIVGTATPESLGKLRSVRVYQDGVLTNEILAMFSGQTIEVDVPRLSGTRWVSLVAVDEDGLVSLPVGRDLGPDSEGLPNVRLLAVGIDQYDDERIVDLNLARSDAVSLDESLKSVSGKSVELTDTTVLTDHEASAEAVLSAAEKLVAESRPGEMAVFFFAGHGVKGEDGRYYMATSTTDPDNISGTALSWDRLSAVLAKSKARMTVFLDSCHSGAAGTDFFATNDDAAAGILKNIPSGLTVFSASKGRELSEENPGLGGGVFTTAVNKVISGDRVAFDLNKNGVIEVSELYVGVKRQVVNQTDARQTPWLARNQMIGDFALF